MNRSTERILTTHVGSLRRPDDLMELVTRRDNEQPYDEDAFHHRLASAVQETVFPALVAMKSAAAPAVPALVALFENAKTAHATKQWILAALGAVGPADPQVLPLVTSVLKTKKSNLHESACSALQAMGPAAAPAIPDLLQYLRDQATHGDTDEVECAEPDRVSERLGVRRHLAARVRARR